MESHYLICLMIIILFGLFIYTLDRNKNSIETFNNIDYYFKRKCFSSKISVEERNCFIRLIKIVNGILSKHNITWIPIGGNLLSIYRYKTLILPWDDDFDFVVEKDKVKEAITALRKELPRNGCKISPFARWNATGSILYKIYFDNDHKCIKNKLKRRGRPFNWPFIDFFAGSKMDNGYSHVLNFRKTNMARDISETDYPLINIKCEGMNIKVPGSGFRSYEEFLKKGIIKTCFDDSWSHKYEKHIYCSGQNKKSCDSIDTK